MRKRIMGVIVYRKVVWMIKNLIDNDGYNDLYFILVVSI
jgi:hypothetical protein